MTATTGSTTAESTPLVAQYALQLGDDALILSHRLSEWCSHSPELEEDVALANLALDLLGQARTLLTYAGSLEGAGRSEDDLAFLRTEREFRNVLLVEQPNGDFAVTIARQLYFATYQSELYTALCDSTDPELAALAAKAVKEVAYHRDHAVQWTLRLGDGTEESHRRMQAALELLWPYTAELFAPDPVVAALAESGVAVDPRTLRPAWEAAVAGVVEAATLAMPADGWQPRGGREGRHSEGFGLLLGEMQALHRQYPGASW
ncbi:ring-1,2-phenylacetyl-CoA epoxidase subunit PaaC [Catenulispora sp. GP43]|uniref:1,2-phenylacetyl-CoA epoxidase subunit PaaC n=1 Tax=Catenulispora sp. GP43 TaxID=3156263 RepID=UPI00351910E9